eukprot:1548401-Amphidinium_carterae.1
MLWKERVEGSGLEHQDDQWQGLMTGCIYCIVMLPVVNVRLLTILGRSPQTWCCHSGHELLAMELQRGK